MIRCLAIHPSLPYILSCSDDMLIKLWDWEKVGVAHRNLPACWSKASKLFTRASWWASCHNRPHWDDMVLVRACAFSCVVFLRVLLLPWVVGESSWVVGKSSCAYYLSPH